MKYFNLNWLLLFIIYTTPASSKNSYQIDHLEPPFWWAGMADNTLQLMAMARILRTWNQNYTTLG